MKEVSSCALISEQGHGMCRNGDKCSRIGQDAECQDRSCLASATFGQLLRT